MVEREDRKRSNSAQQIVMSSKYSGSERRRNERRGKTDRRDTHRVDGKVARRTGKGRRKGEKIGLFLKDVAKK